MTITESLPVTLRVRTLSRRRLLRRAALLLVVVVVAGIPFQNTPYHNLQLTLAAVWIAAACGVNLLTGYNGQLSLATSAFFGLGAYAEAILVTKSSVPYLAALPVVAVAGFAVGFVVGIPATRLRGLYLALLTLAIAVSLPPLLNRFASLTGGSQGLILPQLRAPQGSGLASDQWLYFIAVVVAAISMLLCRNLTAGGIGRAIVAQKDDSVVAEVLGIRLFTNRTLVFAISSMLVGLSGAVYALVIGLLNPDAFTVMLSVTVLAGVVVGGAGTVLGSIVAGLFIEYTPVVTGNVSQSLSGVVYGVLLIAVMLLMPDGIVGASARAIRAASTFLYRIHPRSSPAAHHTGDQS